MDTVVEQQQTVPVQRRRRWWGGGKYIAVLQVSVANNLAYIVEVFFRALMLIAIIFILSQLWKTTYAIQGVRTLSGFSISDMIWYLCAAEAVAMSLPTLTRRIDEEVRSGQLAYLLSRPCSYILYNFAHYLGERIVRFSICCIVGAGLALLIVGLPHFTLMGILAWPLTVLFAFSIEFVCYFAIGLLAFWTEETQSFSFLYSRITLVLGGVLAPLEIFPQPLRSIAQTLPFSTILYVPARTLVHFQWDRLGWALLQQSITLIVGALLLMGLYTLAMRRVNINGG